MDGPLKDTFEPLATVRIYRNQCNKLSGQDLVISNKNLGMAFFDPQILCASAVKYFQRQVSHAKIFD
jgi:hypothetical protein